MTTDETTPRRRGRPKKVAEDHQTEVTMAPQIHGDGGPLDDFDPASEWQKAQEADAMQNQIRFQMKALMQLAVKAGIDPFEGFEKPPTGTTVVVEKAVPTFKGRPKAGSLLGDPSSPNVAFVPWRKDDLDSEDTIDFVPQPIPSLVFPLTDEEGRQKIKLDVNDLVCWLTVGVSNKTNRFFYNAYMDSYNSWRELENFKRRGPEIAPWGRTGPDGRSAWLYDPAATTFGMDIDGRSLTPLRDNPMRDTQGDNPDAI